VTLPKYIQRDGSRFRVRIIWEGKRISGGVWDTEDEARIARDKLLADYGAGGDDDERDAPTVYGDTLAEEDSATDADALWRAAFAAQTQALAAVERKRNQAIILPNEPVAIAFLSDLHFGSAGTDYEAAKRDAERIRDTPGMYAVFHGDGLDNWLIGKLQGLQRNQAVSYDAELRLFAAWLTLLRDKLLVVVSGNHDLWTHKLAGLDLIANLLRGVRCLYDRHQSVFTLRHASTDRRVVVRHKWRYGSIYNPTHGLEVGWDRGDINYDWAIGGHTHIATLCRAFYRHNAKRYAILTGTYKKVDAFGEELGVASSKDRGCGAMVLHPDGRQFWTEDLETAALFMEFLRSKA
jgi:hypothetical protein